MLTRSNIDTEILAQLEAAEHASVDAWQTSHGSAWFCACRSCPCRHGCRGRRDVALDHVEERAELLCTQRLWAAMSANLRIIWNWRARLAHKLAPSRARAFPASANPRRPPASAGFPDLGFDAQRSEWVC